MTKDIKIVTLSPASTLSPDQIARLLFGKSIADVARDMHLDPAHPLLDDTEAAP